MNTHTLSLDLSRPVCSGMGELHLEIVLSRLREEYKVDLVPGRMKVAFRERLQGEADVEHHLHRELSGRLHVSQSVQSPSSSPSSSSTPLPTPPACTCISWSTFDHPPSPSSLPCSCSGLPRDCSRLSCGCALRVAVRRRPGTSCRSVV